MSINKNLSLIRKIEHLKKRRRAVILAHNYQRGEVQDIADFTGDSLELSQKAAETDAEVIVFCGVHFMAETASLLSPDKIVLLPDLRAGCPMADMATVEELKKKKGEHPQAIVVCYVNSAIEVKAESDVCCTSANARTIVSSLDERKEVLFVPDQFLGKYVSTITRRKIIFWPGYCPTHIMILPEDIRRQRKKYPGAQVIVHPECEPEVTRLADKVLSTGGMVRYAGESDAKKIIVGTEVGMLHRLKKENPEKEFIAALDQAVCPSMKLITLEKILWALEEMQYQIKVPENIRQRAKSAVDKMLEYI